MNTFKKIIAIVVLSTVLFSCSSDDNADYIPRTNLVLRSTDSDDGLTMDYTYDSNNRLINLKRNNTPLNPALDQNFTYNSDGTLNEIREAVGNALVMKYFYSGTKVVRKEGNNGVDVYQYSYSGNTVNENYIYTITNTGFRNVYTYDARGNITQVVYYSNTSTANPLGTYSATETRTYDDKRNALESLPAAFLFPGSVNNEKSYEANGGPTNVINYEYNADNYPTKKIRSYTRTYEYRQL